MCCCMFTLFVVGIYICIGIAFLYKYAFVHYRIMDTKYWQYVGKPTLLNQGEKANINPNTEILVFTH